MKKRSKFIGIMLVLTLLLTLFTTGIIILRLSEYKKEEVTYSAEEKNYNASSNTTVFEEFKKSDGTTYNYTPNIQTVTDLEEVDVLYGNYQFNHTGAASIVSEIIRDSSITINDQWFSKCSTVSGLEWLAQFEDDVMYRNNAALKDPDTGKWMVRGNSSGGELKQYDSDDKIYKAYLVIGQRVTDQSGNNTRLLKEYPVTLVGPNGKYIKTKMQNIREDSSDRYSAYMDVTEFVKEQGYGWYYCCNVPFLFNGNFSADLYASWKLIVIEENTQDVPLRALTLKLGLKKSSEEGVDVVINSSDIKSKATGEVTGQLLYSLEGADVSINSNFLRVIVDGTTYSDIYKETGSKKVYRTDALPMIEGFTRNNVPIENLLKFTSKADKIENYTARKYDNNGTTYTLAGPKEGSDTEIIDVDSKKTNTNVVFGNGKSSFKFNFSAVGCVLHANAMGLAVDIEGTEYDNDIKTEVTDEENSNAVVKGSSTNIYGDSESGLYDTITTIRLDDEISIDEDNFAVTAYYQRTNSQEKIQVPQSDISLNGHNIMIAWGDDTEKVSDLTLYGYTLTYEISGIIVESGKTQYENEVIVTGKLFSSGIPTDKEVGDLAKEESYVEYTDFIVQKKWIDNSNALKLRPDTITIDLYRDGVENPISTYEIPVDKNQNYLIYTIPHLLIKDDVKTYSYYIKEREINLSNGDKYVTYIDGEQVTNKLTGSTSKNASIIWDDFDNRNDSRPEKVTIELKQNGIPIKEYELDVGSENNYNFTNLPKYDENGALYEYTLDLKDVEGYTTTIDGSNILNKLNQIDYKVEYYYEGVIDSNKSETITAYYKDIITTYNDKNIHGYRFDKVENAPLTVSKENLVIKVYYVKRTDLSYTVKYINPNEDTVMKEDKIVNNQRYDDEITEKAPEIPGFYCVNPEETIKITTEENIIIFEYERRTDIEYSVEYYYANVLDEDKTEKYQGTFEDIVEGYVDKTIIGYEFNYVEGLPLTISAYPEQNKIKVHYKKIKYPYTVNYYYDGYFDVLKTETFKEEYSNIVDTYKEKLENGYELDRVENFPLKITTDPYRNIIDVYYTLKDSQIKIKYLELGTNAELAEETVLNGKVTTTCNLEKNKKEIEGYKLVEEPKELRVRFKEETQEFIFYYSKKSEVFVKYLEKDNTETNDDNKILGQEVIEGYTGLAYTTIKKDFENYVFADASNNVSGKMTDEPIEVYYYYNRMVSGIQEKHIDIKSEEVLDTTYHEVFVGENYKIDSKEFEGYDLVEEQIPENNEGILTKEPIEVKYYYIRKTSVKVEYIDNETGKTIPEVIKIDEDNDGEPDKIEEKDSSVIIEGHQGDQYKTTLKEFDGYVFIEDKKPTNPEGSMEVTTEEGKIVTETAVKYYYALETKVVEKHIDAKSNEILEQTEHDGYVGKEYNTTPKEFEGYDLVIEQLPVNISGTMTKDVIEVIYSYIRKTSLKVEHINKKTGEIIMQTIEIDSDGDGELDKIEEKPIIDIISGHEGDEYSASERIIEDYTLDEESLPENAEGTMMVSVDGEGNINTEIVVKYYYLPKVLVIEKHIDIKTDTDIEPEIVHKGDRGEAYKTENKEYINYDLVEERIPENAEGTFEEETIIVKYYYIRKVKVTSEYINNVTGEKIKETIEVDSDGDGTLDTTEEKDSTVIIDGHEGDEYKTSPKEFEGYVIVEEKIPENNEGIMEKENIYVKYYYARKAEVIVEHIEEKTGEKIKEPFEVDSDGDGEIDKITAKESTEIINGYEGKEYKVVPKEFDNYKVIEEKLPDNSQGTMTVEPITVKYYYVRKAKVIVEFIDEKTGEKIVENIEVDSDGNGKPDKTEEKASTVILEGQEGDNYKTTPKEFEDYELIEEKLPTNSEGIMTISPITVKYYYIRKAKVVAEYIDIKTGEILKETIEIDSDGDGKTDKTEEKDSTVITIGYEGDSYKTKPKEIEGYDLVEEKLPENNEGIMTREPITVKYYYVRKAKVNVEFIEEKTGKILKEKVEIDSDGDGKPDEIQEKDSSIVIEGHEGEKYQTIPKTFDGYKLIKEKIPENAEGEFEKDVITVKYYYKKIVKVITEHIDEKTGKIIKVLVEVDKNEDGKPDTKELKDAVVVIESHEGEKYQTTPKEFKQYDLIEEKLPKNAEGTVGENDITVKYYYIRKVKVTAEYIDKITGKTIKEMVEIDSDGDGKPDKTEEKDSSVIINGHEGDQYKTTLKKFEGYDIVETELPKNTEGVMEKEDIYVKYYYLRKTKVIVEYINKDTGEKFKETIGIDIDSNGTVERVEQRDSTVVIEGHEGDKYTTIAKVFDGFKVVETTKNENGIMKSFIKEDGTVETTTYVRYYYSEKTGKVIARYLERGTHKVLAEEVVKVGKPGEEYTTEAKEIELYTLDKEPENKKGVMIDGEIIVNYYYYFTNPPPQSASGTVSQIKGDSANGTNTIIIGDDSTTISTGDKVLVTYTSIIIFVVFVNIIQLIISKRKNNKKEKINI